MEGQGRKGQKECNKYFLVSSMLTYFLQLSYNHRKSTVGEGHFFFTCQRAPMLYYAIKNTMDLLQPERSPISPLMALESSHTTEHDYDTSSECMYIVPEHLDGVQTHMVVSRPTCVMFPEQHNDLECTSAATSGYLFLS